MQLPKVEVLNVGLGACSGGWGGAAAFFGVHRLQVTSGHTGWRLVSVGCSSVSPFVGCTAIVNVLRFSVAAGSYPQEMPSVGLCICLNENCINWQLWDFSCVPF